MVGYARIELLMSETLVILAAGLGSRYGGLKQIDPVGPNGETILEYSIHDAVRAGFTRVVFITRRDIKSEFQREVGKRIEGRVAVQYACQELGTPTGNDATLRGRTKPWGTGQAVLAAKPLVSEPFAVVNADDFYGASSFAVIGEHLGTAGRAEPPEHAMVGFTLQSTLSEAGAVSRGICSCDDNGCLVEIVERTRIERAGAAARYVDDNGNACPLSGMETVSMNMWGFGASIFGQLEELFARFIEENGASLDAEFHLPGAVNELIGVEHARVRVLSTTDLWCGITYAQDKPRVRRHIRELVDRGVYPSPLWR